MRHMLLVSMVVLVIAVSVTTIPAQDMLKTPQEEASPRCLDEDFWYDWHNDLTIYLVKNVEHHLHLAHVYFQKGEMQRAADEIRAAAALVKLERYRAKREQYNALTDSYRKLEKLADDVEGGKTTAVKELEKAFAHAHYALARHHYRKSSESWMKKDAEKTGAALRSAAVHLKHAGNWAHQKEEELIAEVVKEAHLVAEKLTEAGDWASEEVDKVLAALEQMIEPEKE